MKLKINVRKGIVANRQFEAIITLPYELSEYQQFSGEFHDWIMDHKPPTLINSELPPSYQSTATFTWTTSILHAPPCPSEPILSLVKTSRSDAKLRKLTRLIYSLDLRRDPFGSYPSLRFILGKPKSDENLELTNKINEEIETHGDIILGDFNDTYDNLPLKVCAHSQL